MKLYLKRRYYKGSQRGRDPIRFHVRQPRGVGTDVHGTIWLEPVLKKRQNTDLRTALLKHELVEIKAWGKGGKGSHTRAKSREPALIRNIGGVSGFWREIAKRNKAGPGTMKRDKNDPRVLYDPRLNIENSGADPDTGYIVIGIKDHPTKQKREEVLAHERSHLGGHSLFPHIGVADIDNLTDTRHELWAYARERKSLSPEDWNRILPSRIRQFMTYVSWVPKKYQAKLKPQTKRNLSPKTGGGNEQAIKQAQVDLARWWAKEERVPTRLEVVTIKKSVDDIYRELNRKSLNPPQAIKPGVGYASKSGRKLCRSHRKGFRKVRFA